MNGILFISEKVRSEDVETQEACTWIYEDFKERRGYSRTYIARKKDALMNVLIPYSDAEMIDALKVAGFHHVEIIAKWNNFSTFVARRGKAAPVKVSSSLLCSSSTVLNAVARDYPHPRWKRTTWIVSSTTVRCISQVSGLDVTLR